MIVCKKSNQNRQSRKGDKGRKIQKIESNKRRRSERSSSYSTDHEHTKRRWREECEASEGLRGRSLGGVAQAIYCCSLNSRKLGLTKGFFPGKICKPFACKRNYFILQSETAIFPVGESTMWNVSM